MPQCYTDGGDRMQDLGIAHYAAQSFTPLTTHILHYIDLELDTVHPTRAPTIWVYLADANHKPTGSPLSHSIRHTAKRNIYQNPFRARSQMSPYELQAATEYVIVVHAFALDASWHMRWQYNEDDAEYPRGIRLISTDGGNTWAPRPNDDHMFCEFGTPPTPPPPPEPPIPLFFILDIQQILLVGGFKIIVTTNVPCHLWMRWTTQKPWIHSVPVLRRGIQMHTDVYFCFTVYTDNEQEEPGDTIIHTFIKLDWPVCETRYFYFTGTIDGEPIPSTTAIFSKHRAYDIMVFHPDAHPETSSVDGYVGHSFRWLTWPNLVDASGTFAFDALDSLVHQFVSWANPGEWERMVRPIIVFDTSPLGAIPGLTIVEATLKIWLDHKDDVLNAKPDYALYSSLPNSDTALIPADYAAVGNTRMSTIVPWDDWIAHESSTFTLNAAGIANINPSGKSRFSIRDAKYEVPHLEPPFVAKVPTSIWLHSADYGGHAIPTLTITYKVES